MEHTKRDTSTFEIRKVGQGHGLLQTNGAVCREFIERLSAKMGEGTRLWAFTVNGDKLRPDLYFASWVEYESWLAAPAKPIEEAAFTEAHVEDVKPAEREMAYDAAEIAAYELQGKPKAQRKSRAKKVLPAKAPLGESVLKAPRVRRSTRQ
jgi:hypothetical protein